MAKSQNTQVKAQKFHGMVVCAFTSANAAGRKENYSSAADSHGVSPTLRAMIRFRRSLCAVRPAR